MKRIEKLLTPIYRLPYLILYGIILFASIRKVSESALPSPFDTPNQNTTPRTARFQLVKIQKIQNTKYCSDANRYLTVLLKFEFSSEDADFYTKDIESWHESCETVGPWKFFTGCATFARRRTGFKAGDWIPDGGRGRVTQGRHNWQAKVWKKCVEPFDDNISLKLSIWMFQLIIKPTYNEKKNK